MSNPQDQAPGAHVDLILQQISSLPTLSPIAVRIMRLAESGDADLREVARLIESDPATTTKVLALCRRADLGVSKRITTVDRAVVMLGLEAVRAALLSVEIHEAFAPALERGESGKKRRANDPPEAQAFDRRELWRHCLAVACAAELIVEQGALPGGFTAQEAFLAGLLHDLGKLALDALLPRSFERVAALAQDRQLSIADVERKVIGLDHHAAGKRLAEHWGLPHALQDVIWLHGQPVQLLPDVPHRALIGVVTVADAMARRLHLGWSGNFLPLEDIGALASQFGIDERRCAEAQAKVHDRVSERSRDLGLDAATSSALLLECIGRANGQLGRVTAMLDRRARESHRSAAALDFIAEFLARDGQRQSFASALTDVLRSARESLGDGAYALLTQPRDGAPWALHSAGAEDAGTAHVTLDPPAKSASLAALASPSNMGTGQSSVLAWLAERVKSAASIHAPKLLPLCGDSGGLTAVLLHDRNDLEQALSAQGVRGLAAAWGAALASASRHDGARRMSEQLADANRRVAEAQSKLVEHRSMMRLSEVAAGAAHEMNNPLMVISGMAQSLLEQVREPEKKAAAAAIVKASEKLSELITSLHLFADPPRPRLAPADAAELVQQAARMARQRAGASKSRNAADVKVNVSCGGSISPAMVDSQQISLAVTELILNALQSGPRKFVDVRLHVDPFDDRLIVTVSDDGAGMSQHALEHAFDPFFSELPAGRRTGLGLTRARRYVDLHGGELVLESKLGKGTTARISFTHWRAAQAPVLTSEAA